MKNRNILVLLCLLAAQLLPAQEAQTPEKAWKFDGVLGLNATGTGLVNWAAGGNNNVSGLAFVKLHLLYHKDNIAWETNFDTDFGMTWVDQDEDQLKKSSDNIKLATKFGWEFNSAWYLTALASFQSQYAVGRDIKTGYNPPISKWLAPSYTDISIGIDWKKNVSGCDFSVFLSPVAGRITTAYVSDEFNRVYSAEHREAVPEEPDYDFRRDMQTKYGTYKVLQDNNGQPDIDWRSFRAELGLSFKGTIAYKYDNMTLGTTLTLFTPYQGRGYDLKEAFEKSHPGEVWNDYFRYSNLNRHFGNFDVDWDVNISYQFAKVLNVTLSTTLKYYPGTLINNASGDARERVQFKTVVGLGIGYSF